MLIVMQPLPSSFGRHRNTTAPPPPPRPRSKPLSEPLSSWCSIPSFKPPQSTPSPRIYTTKPDRGLYIQFTSYVPTSESPPPYRGMPRLVTSRNHMPRLRKAIAVALQCSRMESPNAEKAVHMGGADSPGGRSANGTESLFMGTYGQTMLALKKAGLVTTPCPEEGLENGGLRNSMHGIVAY